MEENDPIFISRCTRQLFHSDFEFYLSILIIRASHLEIPTCVSPVKILGGYKDTKEITVALQTTEQF